MKKNILFSFFLFILITPVIALSQKPVKILMVIAQTNFRDEEYFIPKSYFLQHHATVITVSTKLKKIHGMLGKTIRPDMLISEINPDNFDAIIFPGGIGVTEFWTNQSVFKLIRTFYNSNKIIGAECLSPLTLAYADILFHKKVTAFISIKNDLTKQGCLYINNPVVVDKNIITSNGPKAAKKFAQILLEKTRSY